MLEPFGPQNAPTLAGLLVIRLRVVHGNVAVSSADACVSFLLLFLKIDYLLTFYFSFEHARRQHRHASFTKIWNSGGKL